MLGNNLIQVKTVRFNAQGTPITASSPNLGCLYVSGVDLYYNDESGNQVRLTQAGAVSGTPGNIANLTSPASATFVSVGGTFVWQSAANTAATMDMGSIVIRDLTASANGVTIAAPLSLAAPYTLYLPAALPASNSFVTVSTAGALGTVSQTAGITGSNISASLTQSNTGPGFKFVPSGTILPFGGASAPSGFLLCDGTSYLQSAYPSLYSAISGNYGTTGSSFNVPDLRGMFLRGVTGSSSNDPDAAGRTAQATGGNTGNNVGSQQSGQIQSHSHGITTWSLGNNGTNVCGQSADSVTGSNGTNSAGGNETRPINVYVTYIIAT